MKNASKTGLLLIFLFIILGAIVCQNIEAAVPTPATLRERASILQNKISLCERDISQGAPDCYVIVNWEGNRKVSISEATQLAAQYLRDAQAQEQMQADEERRRIAFYRLLNDPERRGQPTDAPNTNNQHERSAYNYANVIKQFDVEHSKRYENDDYTYCNIFVWDVTRAMGAEIPHWSNERKEMKVYQIIEWLRKDGKAKGWRLAPANFAQQMANDGKPAIAIWKNPRNDEGHVAVVRPGSVGFPEGPAIAQAGRLIVHADHLDDGFNDPHFQKKIEFWYHE